VNSQSQVARNAPCPCGSGKKYKKCHGAASSPGQSKPDYVSINRAVAYKGGIGRLREAFCVDYTAAKKEIIHRIESGLPQMVAANGKSISCSKGCSHCCLLFVVASLQECECIVYYLYHHEEALQHFLRAFSSWRERVIRIERCFRKINLLHEKITCGEASKEEEQMFDAECDLYARQNIPCPFLVDGACSIYEVRPYVCARLAAVTPAEWCQPGHPRQGEVEHFKAEIHLDKDMPYFMQPKGDCVFSCMPFLVYRILEEGYDVLSSVPGLENLKKAALSDPEIQSALSRASFYYPTG